MKIFLDALLRIFISIFYQTGTKYCVYVVKHLESYKFTNLLNKFPIEKS